jgi:hypothetical protein
MHDHTCSLDYHRTIFAVISKGKGSFDNIFFQHNETTWCTADLISWKPRDETKLAVTLETRFEDVEFAKIHEVTGQAPCSNVARDHALLVEPAGPMTVPRRDHDFNLGGMRQCWGLRTGSRGIFIGDPAGTVLLLREKGVERAIPHNSDANYRRSLS